MMKVSVVIPCYNVANLVIRALESVAAQDYHEVELICVDDGSTDQTLDVLKSWKAKYPDMHILEQKNHGSNSARNKGTQSASGTYIQFLDADDVLEPSKLSTQVKAAEKAGFPPIVVGSYRKIDEQGKKVYEKNYTVDRTLSWSDLMRTDLGITSSNLFKRDSVFQAGSWDEGLKSSQEYDMMFRIMQHDNRITSTEPIHTIVLQRSAGSISSTDRAENWKRYIDLRLRIKEYVLKEDIEMDSEEVDSIIFDSIRMLYPYAPEKAIELHEREVSSDFVPHKNSVSSMSYVILYKLFGFRKAEKIRAVLK